MHPIDRLNADVSHAEWMALLDKSVREQLSAGRYSYAYGRVQAMLAAVLAGDITIDELRARLLEEAA